MISRFALHRPTQLAEAAGLLATLEDATPLAGGTELLQVMKLGFARHANVVDLKRIPELAEMGEQLDGRLRIGATATHRQIERSELVARRLPQLARLERQVANVRVRNAGTLGGNLCFAEPHSDPAPLLVACHASVELARSDGTRSMSVADFLTDAFTTQRTDDEILLAVVVPLPPTGSRVAVERIALGERPTVSVAARVDVDAAGRVARTSVVVGAVGPRPFAWEAPLAGLDLAEAGRASRELAELCGSQVELLDDLELSEPYRRHLVSISVWRALDAAIHAA